MSTPQLVPMIASDGSIGDIPADRVNDALASGKFKRGVNVINKDGQRGTIPIERLGEALQSGMMPEHAMQMRRPMNTTPSLGEQVDSGLQTVGNAVPGAIRGMLHAFANPVQAGSQMAIAGMQSAAGQPTTSSKVAAGVAPFVGVDPEAVKKAAITAGTTGNYGPLVGSAALPLAAAHLGASKAGPQVDAGGIVKELAAGEIPSNASSLARVDPVAQIATIVNKGNRRIDAYQTVKPVIQDLQQAAKQTGTDLSGRNPITGFNQVAQTALNNHEAVFQPIVKQYTNETVSGQPVADALNAKADALRQANPVYSEKLATEAKRFQRNLTIGELDEMRRAYNTGDATALSREASGGVRNLEYGKLNELSGQNLDALKARESKLITIKQAGQKASAQLSNQQSYFDSVPGIQRLADNVANKGPVKGTFKTVIGKSPAEAARVRLRQALSGRPYQP